LKSTAANRLHIIFLKTFQILNVYEDVDSTNDVLTQLLTPTVCELLDSSDYTYNKGQAVARKPHPITNLICLLLTDVWLVSIRYENCMKHICYD